MIGAGVLQDQSGMLPALRDTQSAITNAQPAKGHH